ncbi:MAG: rhomboid family intramembrane serine protease [bacterium]
MIPYKDDNPTSTIPSVTIALILLNAVIFFGEVFSSGGIEKVVFAYGAIPAEMLPLNASHFKNIISSMFLHGGLFHIAGNMLYLWIFGNNIEDRLGHLRFLLFYLVCGIVAAYSHAITEPSSVVPMVGASGAISGILGAYLLLYPHAKVHTILFLGFFVDVIMLPAVVVIGLWAVIQFMNGVLTKGLLGQGGIAWFAHIGGFLFGILTIKLWLPKRRRYWK